MKLPFTPRIPLVGAMLVAALVSRAQMAGGVPAWTFSAGTTNWTAGGVPIGTALLGANGLAGGTLGTAQAEVFTTDGPNNNMWRMKNAGTLVGSLAVSGSSWTFKNNTSTGRMWFLNGAGGGGNGYMLSADGTSGQINAPGGPTVSRAGFVAIGYRTNMTDPYDEAPWTRLHLVDDNGTTHGSGDGFRTWMRNGLTITGYYDQMYFGQKSEGSGQTSSVIQWGNEMSQDRLRFIFSTTLGGAGASSNEGLEFMRMKANSGTDGYVGIGDFGTIGTDDPQDRLDIRTGDVRIRDLPLAANEAAAFTQFVVVDPTTGELRWRTQSSSISNGCGTAQKIARNAGGGNLDCSIIWDNGTNVGIDFPSPSEKLEVNGNARAAEFHATTEQSGYKLGNVAQTVLAHGTNGALALGYSAGLNGSEGTHLGDGAGAAITNGLGNTIVGYNAGNVMTTGYRNALVGRSAGSAITTGVVNTFIGARSGEATTTAIHNVFVGHRAGDLNVTGHLNVVVGSASEGPWGPISGPISADLCNTGTFGFNTTVSTSHTQRFGSKKIQRWGFGVDPDGIFPTRIIRVNLVPENTTSWWGTCPSSPVPGGCEEAYMDNQGIWYSCPKMMGQQSSSEVEYGDILKKLLETPMHEWVDGERRTKHIAVSGEDFQKAFGLGDGSTMMNTVDPVGVALAAIKGLEAMVSDQELTIADKQSQIDALTERIERLEQLLTGAGTQQGVKDVTMGADGTKQLSITPNPFSERTTITYTVNCNCRVRLEISAADGKPMRTLLDEQRAEGTYTFEWNTADIAPGMYICTLLVDGKPSVKQAVKVN